MQKQSKNVQTEETPTIDTTVTSKFVLRVSVTSRCQMHCEYCSHDSSTRHEIPYEEMKDILKACYDVGFRIIHWTGGEPLVRRDFLRLVQYAKLCGFDYQKMTTNGAQLIHLADGLREAGIDRINVSLDTLDKDKYERITRSQLFNTVIEGIRKTVNIFGILKINVCVTNDNISEIIDFIELSNQYSNRLIIKFLELVPCQNIYEMKPALFRNEFISITQIEGIIFNHYGPFVAATTLDHSRKKCRYYRILRNNMVFGLNPNQSINYACQKNDCMDFRINPVGYMAECSVNLKNLLFLPDLSSKERRIVIQGLVAKKVRRDTTEWASYKHQQKYYGFWRFGIRSPVI